MRKIENILLLAGGNSIRFWPLGEKNLLSFLGKSVILHQIEQLTEFAENITIVSNKINYSSIIQIIKAYKINSIKIVIQDDKLPGQGGAVLSAKDKIKGEVLVLNTTDILDFDILHQFNTKLSSKKYDFIFLAKKTDEYFPGAYVKFDNKKITGFIEKPDKDKTPSNILKLVVDYFGNFDDFITALNETKTNKDDLYEESINTYLHNHNAIDYVEYDDYWYPLKYPWHVLPLMKHFLSTVKGSYIGKNVSISKLAKIIGPIYIGDNTVIGDYALVRESHIGNNCLIGGYCEVARSYVSDKVMLHRNYVGDSVLGEKVMMGAGTVTANFRFDEKCIKDTNLKKLGAMIGAKSKIGVNSTLFPGVKIGKNSLIGPGEIVDKDIGDNKFIFKRRIKGNIGL